ncbi:unnamed protein product [Mytilus edulis]|uniref:C-type lectin domain-containing protein n=1 Tax=Mytilus edulis TaxID=6550 RepID=A0A8S3QGV9_MYTED|nr:unnamed protein product [Mytilus edulis]
MVLKFLQKFWLTSLKSLASLEIRVTLCNYYSSCNSYTFVPGLFTFQAGRNECLRRGSDLAIITDIDMHNEVLNLLAPKIAEGVIIYKTSIITDAQTTTVSSTTDAQTTTVSSTTDAQTTTVASTTDAQTTTVSSTTDAQTTTVASTTDAQTTTVPSTTDAQTTTVASTTDAQTTTVAITTDAQTTTVASTTDAQTTTVASTTDAQTTTVAGTTDAQATTVASTPDTTVMETTSESTKKQIFTSFTYSVSESATTTVSSKTNPTTSPEPQELPMITTTKQETSFKPNTDYLPVEFTMLGTFFVNSTQICSCHLLSNQTNLPGKNWNFKIDKRSTNAYIRQHTSAYDGRLSSRIMGYTGIFVIGGVFIICTFADLTTFLDKKELNNQTKYVTSCLT